MYIVTGASDNHFKSLVKFIESVPPSQHAGTYVWDLGLSTQNLNFLHSSFPSLNLRRFPFEEYPTWFNIHERAGEYAWKPVAIWRTAREVKGGILLWCDAGNRITGALGTIAYVIGSQGVYSPISAGAVKQWTHPGCLRWFGLEESEGAMASMLDASPRNGAIVGFDLDNAAAWQLLEEWASLAQQKDCIAPAGSSRDNHRQDQAVLTLLYYRFTGCQGLRCDPVGILTHQDCD